MANLVRVPRVGWQDQYAVMFQSANLFDSANILNPTLSTYYGIKQGTYGFDVLGNPDLSNNQTFLDNRRSTGKPTRITQEFQAASIRAGSSIEFQVTASHLIPWLWTMCQDGTSAAEVTGTAANTQYKFMRYTSSDIEVVGNLIRNMGTGLISHRVAGCIASQIQLQAGEDDVLKASAELMAYHHAFNVDWSTLDSGVSTYSTDDVLLWQDAKVEIGADLASLETVVLPGFDLTLTNNAVAKFYDNQFAQRYILASLAGTGTIQLPWEAHPETASVSVDQGANKQLTDFQANTDKMIVITWGSSSLANSLRIELNVRFGTPVLESTSDDEIAWSLPFTCVENTASSREAITIYAVEDFAWGSETRGVGAAGSYYNF